MKDSKQVFDEGLQRLTHLDEVGFEACFHLASDITMVATYSDYKHGVLIAEVLEGVFSQIGPLFEMYDIPENEIKDISDTISQGLSKLLSVYTDDSSAAFEILADLRFAATKFQVKCHTTWRRLPRKPRTTAGGAT